tara:strand:- start:9439 stop:9747 length:309 start_codon:yes stop_codon:yes gene_type:complete
MPTYTFRNEKTGKEWDDFMSIAEMEKAIKKKHINLVPQKLNIVSGTGSIDSKTDRGWKDVLGKISEAHPRSELAKQYGKRSNKEVKTQQVIEKHRRRRAGKK